MITLEELKKMTIKKIKAFPDQGDAFFSLLEQDPRVGVQNYLKSIRRKQQKELERVKKTEQKLKVERDLYNLGYKYICGIDEVGRGPLAGPVVTAAVILPKESFIIGIDDSKKVRESERERLAELIKKEAVCFAYGSISPENIDKYNILNATKKAMVSAVARLNQKPDVLLIDALSLNTNIEEISLVQGDSISYSIGAASIIAKVRRDKYMIEMDKKYPEYNFKSNKGYGTKEHIEAIKKFGLTPIHRRTFCSKFI